MTPSRSRKRLYAAALAIAVALGSLWWWRRRNAEHTSERTGRVSRDNLVQRVTISGTAEAARTTVIAAPYDGYVKKLFVALGQRITQGDPVVSVAQSLQARDTVFPIRAPFTGVVTQVLKNEGQFTKQGDAKEFVVRLDDLTKMFVHASVPEIDVIKLKRGLAAEIKASAVVEKTYHGSVRDIARAATVKDQWGGRNQVEYLAKIEITDADEDLRPGMTAVVDVITNQKNDVLTLAHEFIRRDEKGHFVLLKNGKRRAITLGLQNETVSEIATGLREGEVVRQVDFLSLPEAP